MKNVWKLRTLCGRYAGCLIFQLFTLLLVFCMPKWQVPLTTPPSPSPLNPFPIPAREMTLHCHFRTDVFCFFPTWKIFITIHKSGCHYNNMNSYCTRSNFTPIQYSPVILWLDLPLIATEGFSSPIIKEWYLDKHTKSPKGSKHGNMSKF